MKKWRLISKEPPNQPAKGAYSDWKEQIAKECFHQCVYCSIHERPWGGIDHYHIDHFRPKVLFEELVNDIRNLFYACPICNRFKSDDWPGEPNLDAISYPDPSQIDYCEIFEINLESYTLIGLRISSKYLIERLYLNRPQLIYERREAHLMQKEIDLTRQITQMIQEIDDINLIKEAMKALSAMREHLRKRENVRPYKLTEIKKL